MPSAAEVVVSLSLAIPLLLPESVVLVCVWVLLLLWLLSYYWASVATPDLDPARTKLEFVAIWEPFQRANHPLVPLINNQAPPLFRFSISGFFFCLEVLDMGRVQSSAEVFSVVFNYGLHQPVQLKCPHIVFKKNREVWGANQCFFGIRIEDLLL